jgi:hypothetical protein
VGYEPQYSFPQPTPVIMILNIHHTRAADLDRPDHIVLDPPVQIARYQDSFGNWCSRILAPTGAMRISNSLNSFRVWTDGGAPSGSGLAGR